MTKKFLLYILTFTLIAFLLPNASYAQQDEAYQKIFPEHIIETQNDSIDIISNFYSFYDSLAVFFSEDTLYDNFDNDAIHYPKVDFSNKLDTSIIILQDPAKRSFYVHPFLGVVTSHFGLRHYRYHYGTDVNLQTGDTIRCAFDGMVRITKWSKSYGYVVVIRHLNGLETLYAHLSEIDVKPDQVVKAGDIIALGGNTGHSFGSHLHFEIRYLGAPINPEDIIDFDNFKLHSDILYLSKYHFRYQSEINKLKEARFVKIKKGQTLSSIAKKYRVKVKTLYKLNKLKKGAKLKAGRSIRIR
jgi:hypothetical protein